MSKKAANEETLGLVHSMLAKVFTRSLERQLKIYEIMDNIPEGALEEEMLTMIADMQEPNPAMLSAIAKFLKDNDIGMSIAEAEQLSATQVNLANAREARRRAGVNLSLVPPVDPQYGT